MTEGQKSRFWDKIDVGGPEACWLWKEGKRSGYGSFWHQGKNHRAHKVAYEMVRGMVPEGLELDHLCKTKLCCNPNHMETVIHKVNVCRARGSYAKCGHKFDSIDSNGSRFCYSCKRSKRRAYIEANRATIRTYCKKYAETHKEQINARNRARYIAKREEILARHKVWREHNKDYYELNKARLKTNSHRYYLANRQKILAKAKARREEIAMQLQKLPKP